MCGRQLGHCDVRGGLVSDKGILCSLLPVVRCSEFGQVSVVVSLHLVIEDLRLSCIRAGDQMFAQYVEDVVTDVFQLLLNLCEKKEEEKGKLGSAADSIVNIRVSLLFSESDSSVFYAPN